LEDETSGGDDNGSVCSAIVLVIHSNEASDKEIACENCVIAIDGRNNGSVMENIQMTVNITPMHEEFTTITDSVKSVEMKTIPIDYFVTKGQRINLAMKNKDPNWSDLKFRVKMMIDSELKKGMLVEAQKLGLKYIKNSTTFMVENFSEIGKLSKLDGSVQNARKVNMIVYGIFDASVGYEYYLENDIMTKVKLKYNNNNKGTGHIASMVARRKANLENFVMKRLALTHDTKITKKRTHEETIEEGKINKKRKYSFQIRSNTGNNWYNRDGSDYRNIKCIQEDSFKETDLREWIKALKDKLKGDAKMTRTWGHASEKLTSNLKVAVCKTADVVISKITKAIPRKKLSQKLSKAADVVITKITKTI